MRTEERESYERQAVRCLELYGVKPPYEHHCLTATQTMTDAERFLVWLAETVHYACREIDRPNRGKRCDPKVVLRCYGQMREYSGRLAELRSPYAPPIGGLLDAVTAFQLWCEDYISKGFEASQSVNPG